MPAATMATWTVLVSFFAAGALAKRIATNHEILPGVVQPALPPHLASMPRASVAVGMSMQDSGNPSKYATDTRAPWREGVHTPKANTLQMRISAEDLRNAIDPFELEVELTPEEVAAAEKEDAQGKGEAMDPATPQGEVMPGSAKAAENEAAADKATADKAKAIDRLDKAKAASPRDESTAESFGQGLKDSWESFWNAFGKRDE